MKALVYSRPALDDLMRLHDFIARNNPPAARRISAELRRGVDRLREFPLMGRPVAQAPDPEMVRDIVLGDYLVRYLVRGRSVMVLRVWHHREDRPN